MRDPIARFEWRSLVGACAAVALSLLPVAARAVNLSGTIQYSGNLGPVSAASPLRIFVFDSPEIGDQIATLTVTAGGGSWSVEVPQVGDYYLIYWLDRDGNLEPSLDEPIEIYRDGFSFDAVFDPLRAPQSGVGLTLGDTWILNGVSGTVSYRGNYPVPQDGGLVVVAYTRPDLTEVAYYDHTTKGGPYAVLALGEQVYIRAHLDVIVANDELDPGEPYVIYNHKSSPPANPIAPGSIVDLVFGDEYALTNTHITGSVTYNGHRGPVSAARPILLVVLDGPNGLSETGRRTITSNGTFDIAFPAPGNRYLLYALDVSGDGILVGAPYQIHRGRFSFPVEAIAAPASGVTLQFDDTARLPGIAGTVTYTGSLGPVSDNRKIILEAANDATFLHRFSDFDAHTNGERYGFIASDLQAPLMYLRAFLDIDEDRQLGEGEPHGACPAPIQAGPDQTNVSISFGDDDGVASCPTSPGPTATPSSSPTPKLPSCIGDCDGSNDVTVDEIVRAVAIALGTQPASACPAADANGDQQVTVEEIVSAVNRALAGCTGPCGTDDCPDLVFEAGYAVYPQARGCNLPPVGDLGLMVCVKNDGGAAAGSFQVRLNNFDLYVVEMLAASATDCRLRPFSFFPGGNSVEIDVANKVQESNEANNTGSFFIAVLTATPSCTISASRTPTPLAR